MSISTSVVGIRPPDEKWQRMKAVWDACVAAGIDPPREVDLFFACTPPDPAGVIVRLDGHIAVRHWRSDASAGYDVDVLKLPADVTMVRFYNSW